MRCRAAWLAVIGFHVSSLPGSGQKSKELTVGRMRRRPVQPACWFERNGQGKRKMKRRSGSRGGDATLENREAVSREDGGTGRDTKEERTGERGWKGREREAERKGSEKERRPARTILINPVPGSRSRSNRVHDLQGIYIRSSTRGYNSIPSFYSALSAGLKQPARHGLSLFLSLSTCTSTYTFMCADPCGGHEEEARTIFALPPWLPLVPLSR